MKCPFCSKAEYVAQLPIENKELAFRCNSCNVRIVVTNQSYLPKSIRDYYWKLVKNKQLTKKENVWPDQDEQLVGNGHEKELDDEWLEDVEWLEQSGFMVEQSLRSNLRIWTKSITQHVKVQVTSTGSLSLLWKHYNTSLSLEIADNVSRRDVKNLCNGLGEKL